MNGRVERMFVVSLGNRVRFLRQLRGLTTRQLAERAGMAPATVNSIELGVRAAGRRTALGDVLKLVTPVGVRSCPVPVDG